MTIDPPPLYKRTTPGILDDPTLLLAWQVQMMRTILVVSRHLERCRELDKILSPLDRRLVIYQVSDTARMPQFPTGAPPELAVVASGDAPQWTLETVHQLRHHFTAMPIVAEVPAAHPLVAIQALEMGASDCLKQPVAPWEWRLRCRNLLVQQRQGRLIGLLREATQRWAKRYRDRIAPEALSALLSRADAMHDAVTGQHELRTGRIAGLIAEALGLPEQECRLIETGAALHDIGKIGIPDRVLHKPGRYDSDDRAVMCHHPRIGYEILSDGATAALRYGAEIALNHHECMDGSGYPRNLSGAEIPLSARITAVADVFDALAAGRPYRTPLSVDAGIAHLQQRSGRQFDPACIEALRSRKEAARVIVQGH